MSLRDAVKNLRDVAKKLNAVEFNPTLDALKNFVDGLKLSPVTSPNEKIRTELLAKFLRGDENFSRRELRELPFIIYEDKISIDDTKKILGKISFLRAGHLRNVIEVYLLNHDGSTKTELLRQRINFLPKTMAGNSPTLQKIFSASEYLFGNERFANMTKLFERKLSVDAALEQLGLSDYFKTSRFIKIALKVFFRNGKMLPAQIELLQRLDEDFFAYEEIFPIAASTLIQAVESHGTDDMREICIDVFYRRLSDPRFGNGRFRWDEVSPKSREIFCHWLCAKELETFFKLVAATSNDKQWRYREKFWREYLPRISKTWIFLGRDARRIAANLSNLNHGMLKSEDSNQSVFVFQIGKYIFSEWSNVGKVRAYSSEHGNFFFGRGLISGDFIRNNFISEQWIHSSPQSGFWQRQLDAWIRQNC